MVKIWAIEQELSNASVQMVLYLDTDVTIRPDAMHWGLVPHLTRGEAARKHPPSGDVCPIENGGSSNVMLVFRGVGLWWRGV